MYNFSNEGAQHCAFANNGCASIVHAANNRGSLEKNFPGGYLAYVAHRIALFVGGTFTPQVQPNDKVMTTCQTHIDSDDNDDCDDDDDDDDDDNDDCDDDDHDNDNDDDDDDVGGQVMMIQVHKQVFFHDC